MKHIPTLLLILLMLSCKGKPSLSDDDKAYVHTTLDLMRTRAKMKPRLDSSTVKLKLDSTYARHHTTAAAYLKYTASLADEPKLAEMVYNAINDSVGAK